MVFVKGMEMPKDCPMCPMAHWNSYDEFTGCEVVAGKKYANQTDTEYMESTSRPDWCPLIEVPQHVYDMLTLALDNDIVNGNKKAKSGGR